MDEGIVEALEEGKIVRVSENYARREGLPIIRKIKSEPEEQVLAKRTLEEERRLKDYSRKHSNWKDKQVISELVDNFNWILIQERKKRGMTRRQMAKSIGIEEEQLRLLESGILPTKDFILVNKVQQTLSVNLRKDGRDFNKPIKDMFGSSSAGSEKEKSFQQKDEIEILDDEI